MVTTRPMIRLSGFSRKTSFDGPSLSSSGCSSFTCPKRGSQQQLTKCDCDCGEASTLFRQQVLHQQQLLQRQKQQRNHHLVLLQLQAQTQKSSRKVLKQHLQIPPPPPQIHLVQTRPVYFPHPPPAFRHTISDSNNSESDREGLEHFHRHLQQLHRLTCASVENAIYCGGTGNESGRGTSKAGSSSKLKSHKSFSFRDIRDIGKKKRNAAVNSSQLTPQTSSSSNSSSPLSPEPSSKQLKRRNTTRSAKDYIGVSRVKLLAKYWSKARSSGTGADSGNGSGSTSRSSDSGDSQLSNYSGSGASSGVGTSSPKQNGVATASRGSPSKPNSIIVSPRSGHKRYTNLQTHHTGSGKSSNTVTYKVRYDVPSSWESEQLQSFTSAGEQGLQPDNACTNNKDSSASSGGGASISSDELRGLGVKQHEEFCTHCGRGPDVDSTFGSRIHSPLQSPQPRKAQLFKNLTFVRPHSSKPLYSLNNVNGGYDKSTFYPAAFSCEDIAAAASLSSTKAMMQPKVTALERSKSQKCPERRIPVGPCQSPNLKLTHITTSFKTNLLQNEPKSLIPKPKHAPHPSPSSTSSTPQPKVRFKEQQHHRSEQCLNERSQERRNIERVSLLRKWTRRGSSSSTATPSSPKSPTTNMLPDERDHQSFYSNCRIPRPKIRGIVPTHSYGVCSSPISRCSSALGENRVRRHAGGDFVEFTEISLQDDDSETSGFESEQNNAATSLIKKDEISEGDSASRKHQAQRNVPAEMTPAGKYFTDFKTLYHYHQDSRHSIQKSPTPSRGLSFRKPNLPALLSRSGKKKGFEDSSSAEFLKSLPIFRKLNDAFFAKLSDHIAEAYFENGNYIFRQGEKGNAMYFLVSGSAKATFKSLETGKSDEIFLKNIHAGDFFGERVFQTRTGYYTHNVVANCEDGVTCVRIDREGYEEFIYKCHDFKIRVLDRCQKKAKLPEEIAKIRLEDLRVVTTLGVGGFGRVELCTLEYDCSRAYALKKMKKCQIVATRQIEHIRSEKSILLETNCDFICKLYKTFKDSKYLYMLMEACLGGELWTVLRDRGRFEDDTAKFYIGCVIEALKYLHSRNIIYRDLKPENLLLDASGYVKLVDFGFAKKLDGRKTWTFCGTPEYCAPEIILNKGHDLSADFWSLGVLMYELLTGTPPFTGGDPLRTYKIILQGIDAIQFPPTVSKYALNLIRKLCRENPAERLGAHRGKISDIKKHKWFDGFDWLELKGRSLTPPIIPDVRGPLDFGNFDEYPPDRSGSPPDDMSGWDWDF